MADPLLFVSHKHQDKDIAEAVGDFVRTVTGGKVDVYLSSNPDFQGPRVGEPLNQELRDALWRAGVVVLVYTAQGNDWSWCMWECGLADDANSPNTKVVVLQCLADKPQVFESGVRVTAWDKDSLTSLAYRFREPDFFPGADGPVTGLTERELKKLGEQLHSRLADLIPTEPPENWSAWAFLRLEVPRGVLEPLVGREEEERLEATETMLLSEALVREASSGLAQLFGRAEVSPNTPFKALVDEWSAAYPERDRGWVTVLAKQILEGAGKKTPRVRKWHRFRKVEGTSESVVGVGRVKKDATTLLFDCYFFGLGSIPDVTSLMTRRDKMYYIDLSLKAPGDVILIDLVKELEDRSWTRVPILDGRDAKYIVHVSMIDRFLRRAAILEQDIAALTLEDLLADQEMKEVFSKTFSLVDFRATIADALRAMRDTLGCMDVFITEPGEGVVGWLTDRDIGVEELRTI